MQMVFQENVVVTVLDQVTSMHSFRIHDKFLARSQSKAHDTWMLTDSSETLLVKPYLGAKLPIQLNNKLLENF